MVANQSWNIVQFGRIEIEALLSRADKATKETLSSEIHKDTLPVVASLSMPAALAFAV
jgi:hypothetical protein